MCCMCDCREEQALIDILENGDTRAWKRVFQVTDEYWKRNEGADHILILPHPVTSYRHPKGRRGFTHYLVQLDAPIFLSLELSTMFAETYPECTRKNMIVPYPNTDGNLYSGKQHTVASTLKRNHLIAMNV